MDCYEGRYADIEARRNRTCKGDVINYRGRKQMKVNQIRLATPEDNMNTQDFVDGAPMSPAEIQEALSHYMLDIENANLQRITRHLIKKYQESSLHFQLQVHIIIILRVV